LGLHGYEIVAENRADRALNRLRVQEHRAEARNPDPARLLAQERTISSSQDSVALTEREFSLLELLVRHAVTPPSRGVIFDALWSTDGSGNENVVDVYIGYLRKKLRGHYFDFKIKTLRNQGFCLTGLAPVLAAP